MPRAINNVASRRRRKRVLKMAKGYRGARSRLFQNAKETVRRGGDCCPKGGEGAWVLRRRLRVQIMRSDGGDSRLSGRREKPRSPAR